MAGPAAAAAAGHSTSCQSWLRLQHVHLHMGSAGGPPMLLGATQSRRPEQREYAGPIAAVWYVLLRRDFPISLFSVFAWCKQLCAKVPRAALTIVVIANGTPLSFH
jgi:hypothetical protein